MKMILEEKMDEIRIPENLHEHCRNGIIRAKLEMNSYEQKQEKDKEENKADY